MELNEVMHPLIAAGIAVSLGLAATIAVIKGESYQGKLWKCVTPECFRFKVLTILLIAVTTKILVTNYFGEQAAFLGDLIVNLNSAIAGVCH